jgi:hypothetical protein
MNRPILACIFFAMATAVVAAQEASQSNPYQGVSNPPADDTIITTADQPDQQPKPKPPAGHPVEQTAPAAAASLHPRPAQSPMMAKSSVYPAPQPNRDGTDDGIVGVAPAPNPVLTSRHVSDSDFDIVHPAPLPPGTLGEGAMIRVRLLDELSSSFSAKGEPFRSRVASDVLQNGQVLIPAGAEIDGHVADVSTGHFAGNGYLLLHPESVKMADGTTYQLHAMVHSVPGTNTKIGSEGDINPGSRAKVAGIQYGAVAGGGAIVGAVLGGPVGALAGSLVGAGIVTTHLLVSHPQTNLEQGTVLILTLTEPMQLSPAPTPGN